MTLMMQLLLWAGLQMGFPVCDIDPNHEECQQLEQIAGDASAPDYGSNTPNMNRVWKIYNGF